MKKINISTESLNILALGLTIIGAVIQNELTKRNVAEIAKKEVEELLKNK